MLREVVEVYRDMEICRCRMNWSGWPPERYEAKIGDWLLMGSDKVSVRWQIDQHLDREERRRSPPPHSPSA